ncbi:MAG: carboxypeptidase-like regulatory domain-containing protein [Acidobacteria bacterium]|nr:carboxypeptidase-like regulatory domain-containing protein [Acidobacteriota bacterium]
MKVMPRVFWCFIRLSILFLWVLTPTSAYAECAVPGPICESFKRATIVFHGEVIEVVAPKGKSGVLKVKFRILEGFKGVSASELRLAFGPSSEEFHFVQGKRLLVYASQWQGLWSAECTRTREAISTDSEVAAVRGLSQSQSGGLLYGELRNPVQEFRYPVGVRVKLRRDGLSGAVVTTTDYHGRFQFPWIPEGRYSLTVAGRDRYREVQRSVEVKANSGCMAIEPIRREITKSMK